MAGDPALGALKVDVYPLDRFSPNGERLYLHLIEQLKPGGRMIIPVGGPFFVQQLMLVEKGQQGEIRTRQVLPVAFVPLTGGH